MSSFNTIGPNQLSVAAQQLAPQAAPLAAVAVETPTTTELPPPQYQSLAFARATVETLGLDLPRTPEDTLAILSAVQQALDKTVDETRNNRAEALAASFRSAVTGWLGLVGQMEVLGKQYDKAKKDQEAKTVERNQKIGERETKIQQSASLQTQIDGKNTQINNLNGQIGTLNGQIDTLNTAIGALPAGAARDALIAQRDAKVGERNSAQGSLNAATAERNSLVSQKQTVDAQIVQLTSDINRLADEIVALEGLKDQISQETFIIGSSIVSVFSPLALVVQNLANSSVQTNAASDAIFNRLFENLAEQMQEFGGMNRIREASQALLEQLENTDAQSRVLGAAAGLLAGLVDVLSTLSNLGETPEVNLTGAAELNGRLQFSVG